MVVFEFVEPAEFVYSMMFLDIDYETTVTVVYMNEEGNMSVKVYDLPLLGDNAKQTLDINLPNVKEIIVSFSRSGAIVSLDFCYDDGTTPPPTTTRAPTGAPTVSPTKAPTGTPTVSPTGAPTRVPVTGTPTKLPTAR